MKSFKSLYTKNPVAARTIGVVGIPAFLLLWLIVSPASMLITMFTVGVVGGVLTAANQILGPVALWVLTGEWSEYADGTVYEIVTKWWHVRKHGGTM